MEQVFNEQTTRDYLRVVFRQKSVIIACFITVMVTVLIGLQFKTPVYESSVKMLISAEKSIDSPYYREINAGYKSEATLTQSEIVTANPVIERAVKAIGLYQRPLDYEASFSSMLKKPLINFSASSMNKKLSKLSEDQKREALFRFAVNDLKGHIKVNPIRDTNLFTIIARDFSPIGSAVIANVVSRSYVIFDLEQQLADLQLKYGEKHLAVTQLRDNIEKMTKNLTGQPISDIEAIGPATVKIIEQSTVPLGSTGPSKYLVVILALFMSVFLGVMLAFMFEYMDQTFKTPSEIETYLNLPCLGSISRNAKINSFRVVSDQIFLLMKDKQLKSLLLSSVMEREGVTYSIKNIAFELSAMERIKVLVIDANFRNPGARKVFKITGDKGLADLLEEKANFDQVIQRQNKNLSVLPAGKTDLNPAVLLSSNRMVEMVNHSKQKYDIVLVDYSPLSNFRELVFLSSAIDGLALVVNEGKTRRQAVKVTVNRLLEEKINLLGVILNNRSYVIPKAIYDRF